MAPENTPPGRGKSSSKPSCSGSMLIFGGVLDQKAFDVLRREEIFWNPGFKFGERALQHSYETISKKMSKT